MVGWALRYLVISVVLGVVFASLSGEDWRSWVPERTASRGAANASPAARGPVGSEVEHVVEAGPHGHYVIEVMVNGTPVTFLIDTGASDVVLNLDDARRVGFEPRTLRYTERFQTANGEVRGAPVTLREVRIGQLQLFDLGASVNEAPLSVSLLGMSFLERLAGYEVRDGRLVLRW
jgi:aspartyl protease family protein